MFSKNNFLLLFPLLFLLIAVLELCSIAFFPELRLFSKPLIMISLLVYYYLNGNPSSVFLTALVFALLGDIFLLFDGTLMFILGLSSFLIMQTLYGFTFVSRGMIGKTLGFKALFSSLLIVPGLFFLYKLLPHTGSLKIPVIIYALSITFMVVGAFIRRLDPYYPILICGAVLFLISDLCLAYSLFNPTTLEAYGIQSTSSSLLVMSSYMLAQYLIVTSYRPSYKS